MKKLLCVSFLSLLTFATAMAGQSSHTRPIGFSKDGKYFAFIEYTMQDGSGFTDASVKFLNIAKNDYAEKAVVVEDRNEMANLIKTREKALVKAQPILTKLGIVKNNFDFLVSRLITDMDVTKSNDLQKKATFSTYHTLMSPSSYEVSLDLKLGKHELCYDEVEAKMLKVSLKKENGKAVVLQEDKELPKSRGCAYDYSIQDIIVKEDSRTEVVVLITVMQKDMEGPSSKVIAITGKLE